MSKPHPLRAATAIFVTLVAAADCGGKGVDDENSARRAYLGLDASVDRGINLRMAGFNAAKNASIPPQTGSGSASGTMTVSGKVDQGASANKEMRLQDALAGYSDGPVETSYHITYDTDPAALPELDLSLRNIPNGTFTGSLIGKFNMSGDLEGAVTLTLSLAGKIQAVMGKTDAIERTPGSTTITGTADSDYGSYDVNLTR